MAPVDAQNGHPWGYPPKIGKAPAEKSVTVQNEKKATVNLVSRPTLHTVG